MTKGIRITPQSEAGRGQSVDFSLAIGSTRQMCRLRTTFSTKNQALSYLQKHRAEFELAARMLLARGETEDGIVQLEMF
ncbi:hypothetical protein ACFFWD_40095 [Bradyrhizobium erythrophlei]|uniref:hypothetical protein n=1 Tax=Bradyrhizobium erythrophlei TaxID=1437360 RepID=UPI0035F0A8F5